MDWPHKLHLRLFQIGICVCICAGFTNLHAYASPPVPTQKPLTILEKIKNKFFDNDGVEKERVFACEQKGRTSKLNSESALNETASIYRQIFEAQDAGDFEAADALVPKLNDCRLMGYVAVQRFLHPTGYKAQFKELAAWLEDYADHPMAARIYKLAEIRRKEGDRKRLHKPDYKNALRGTLEPSLMGSGSSKPKAPASRSDEKHSAVKALAKELHVLIRQEKPSAALDTLNSADITKSMTALEKAFLKTEIAQSYLIEGRYKRAYGLAAPIADKYGTELPRARWIAGLVAWKREDYKVALTYFSKLADAKNGNGWLISAASYWAGRSALREKDTKKYNTYMRQAAAYPRTFYGFLAAKALGQDLSFNWQEFDFSQDQKERLLEEEAGARAILLVKADRHSWADQELAGLRNFDEDKVREAVLAFALNEQLPSLALRYGNSFKDAKGRFYDKALYPLMPWISLGDYHVNPALVHAIVRQESKFAPRAFSHGNAVGLMQVLPTTAAYVSGDDSLAAQEKYKLKEPRLNLDIGQKYILSLLNSKTVNHDLFGLLVSYNAGPGNYAKWKKKLSDVDDPLLFIELIPTAETRAYVERVMRNMWIYEIALSQESESVGQILAGEWPVYKDAR